MDEQNPGVATTEQPKRRPVEIRAEIARTREDMSETVNAIQDRLRPSSIAAASTERLKQAASNKARDLADSEPVAYAAANPVPMVMVGIGLFGLGWLAVAGRDGRASRRESRRYRETNRNDWRSAPSYGAATLDREQGARGDREDSDYQEPGSYDYDRPRDAGAWAAGRSGDRRGDGELGTYLQRTWNENPLVLGVASAVAGALVGLGLPETDRENRWMGETRDSMVEAAQETVREKVEEVQHAATTAVNSVQEAAKSAVGLGSEEASG